MTLILLMALIGFVTVAGTAVIGGVVYGARTARQRTLALPPAPAAERNGMNLRVRDIITHLDRDYLVIGKVAFSETGRTWYAYRLQDGVRLRWLRVARHDNIELHLVDEVDGQDFQSRPPESLTHGLVTYRLTQRGTARATHTGSTGWDEASRVEWYEYRGPADHALFLDRWSGTCAAQAGRQIDAHHLEFLPGDLVEAEAHG
jgi:hypothetical protein